MIPVTDEALALALQFHEVYERLAPHFGYETRLQTRHFDPASPNGKLMIAVCEEILLSRVPQEQEPDRWELYAGDHLFTVCYSREDLEKSKGYPSITDIKTLYTAPPSVALLIAEREAQLSEARQTIIKEGLARDAAEKRVGELEEKLMVLLAIQRKRVESETVPTEKALVLLRDTLNRSFQIGQTYWSQADSESYSADKRAERTLATFKNFVDTTCHQMSALLSQNSETAPATPAPATAIPGQ